MRSEQTKRACLLNLEHNYSSTRRMGRNFRSVASQHKGTLSVTKMNVNEHDAYINTLILLMKLHSQSIVFSRIAGEIFAESLDVLTCEQLRLVKTSNSENHELIQKAIINLKSENEPNRVSPYIGTIIETTKAVDLIQIDEEYVPSSSSSIISFDDSEYTNAFNSKSTDTGETKLSSLSDQQLKLLINNVKNNEDFRSLSKTEKSSVIEEISKPIKEITSTKDKIEPNICKIQQSFNDTKKQSIISEPYDDNGAVSSAINYQTNSQVFGFSNFHSEVLQQVKSRNPDLETEQLMSKIEDMWSELSVEMKQMYQNRTKITRNLHCEENIYSNKSSRKYFDSPTFDKVSQNELQNERIEISQEIQHPSSKRPKFDKGESSNLICSTLNSKNANGCQNSNCPRMVVCDEFRGSNYCSSDCCIKHCKHVFCNWIEQKKS